MNKIGIAGLILGTVLVAACGPAGPAATKPVRPASSAAAVTGTVTYLVRSALPPTAVVEVQLQDVSLADAPAKVISTQSIETQGQQVPIPYVLKYDSAQIDPKHTYAVRATIKDGDKLLFINTQSYPVITNGAPTSDVEIIVEPVASSGTSSRGVTPVQ